MEEKLCLPCEEPVIDKLPPCPLQCGVCGKCKSYPIKKPPVDFSNIPMVWVLGGPGSPVSTHCQGIKNKYGFTHISAGALIRAEAKKDTVRAICLKSVIERSELAPNDVVLELVKRAMTEVAGKTKGYVIEGYPRTLPQSHDFEKFIAPVSSVLYLEIGPEMLTQLLLAKMPGQNDENKMDIVKAHLKVFFENNNRILEQYPHRLVRINAEKDDQILNDMQKALDPVVASVARAAAAAAAATAAGAQEVAAAAAAKAAATAIAAVPPTLSIRDPKYAEYD